MSGSVVELLKEFSVNRTVTYTTRDGKVTSVVLELPLIKAADKFCEDKHISRNEFFSMLDAIAPDNITNTKAMRVILNRLYFTNGDLDINA